MQTDAHDDEDAIARLHPSLVYHVVNTLGWPKLRPLQAAAITPVLDGDDALLLAPTAGGKTEAAAFPLLSRIASDAGSGLQAIYVCPLKALLNNLQPRLESYASWLGLRVALWHGDVGAAGRRAIIAQPPHILLTTPESLEAMLISVKSDHNRIFESLRTIVIDEVHAFAGDDRGWHLLAVTERLARVAGRRLQRIGLSATVGNPAELLSWLQGSNKGQVPARVVAPHLTAAQPVAAPPLDVEIELDYVGSVQNAAKIIATLHRGEKRLVFCESRRFVEELGEALRDAGVTTYLSHASLSADQRRRAEAAFAEARDCVIVATSTLELGIDVGDLDRVIQIDSPSTVASFLQRIGRSGRRAGSRRNYLFLTLRDESLLQAAALLHLWGQGWVEPVVAPPEPRHLVAQQILALCLQEHRIGDKLWIEGWNGLAPFGPGAEPILRHLVAEGFLESDGGMLFIGEQAEKRFGHRHFMDMTAAFTAPPQFTVFSGRTEIGRTDPMLLTEECAGPRRLLLAGRSWQVTYIDWKRRRCFVEPVDGGGRAKWQSSPGGGLSFDLARAIRAVLLGANPPGALTRRARERLTVIRSDSTEIVNPDGTVIVRAADGDVCWWTFAGHNANATLTSTLAELATDRIQRHTDLHVRLRSDITPAMWTEARSDAAERICLPDIDPRAVAGLKFAAALPERLATATLAARLAAPETAHTVLAEPTRWLRRSADC